jgi:hypothetical protein
MPAQAEDAIRLFEPVPAGKVIVLTPPSGRTAYASPRPLVVHAAPAIRGSLKDGEAPGRPTPPTANSPWLVAPQITPEATHTTAAPSTDDGEAPKPRVIRNAAR